MATATVLSGTTEDVVHPPVVASSVALNNEERQCRACHSRSLRVDWAQGDRVCTDCGVVDEGHLLDDRPEWREFHEADDLAKGKPALARSGLVLVDESKWLGGLQPTTLSRHVYGSGSAATAASRSLMTRKRLLAANRRLDKNMERMHARALETAKLSHKIRKRRLATSDFIDDNDNLRPEYEQMIVQEEEDANRMQAALYADKWSLERAIRLHGSCHESSSSSLEDEQDTSTDELRSHLDSTLQQASQDLYQAYSCLHSSAQRLHLPDRVTIEATTLLCRYATRRDGIVVRGVSSTLKRKKKSTSSPPEMEKEAKAALHDYNKMKQSGALCAALLFYTSRMLGWPRSLVEVCASIQPLVTSSPNLDIGKEQFIKKKHCSRAMSEVKEVFPDLARSVAAAPISHADSSTVSSDDSSAQNIVNFAEHTIRRLHLPPVAEACMRALVIFWQQLHQEACSGPKLSTTCAAMAFFVCHTGDVMQRLAAQASKLRKRKASILSATAKKKIKVEDKQAAGENGASLSFSGVDEDENPFDVFDDTTDTDLSAEQRAYEMQRVWDAWAEQMPWFRSLADLEQSCGVASNAVLEYYRKQLYPERQKLLNFLKDATGSECSKGDLMQESSALRETPLASVLLPQIAVASTLLKADGKS